MKKYYFSWESLRFINARCFLQVSSDHAKYIESYINIWMENNEELENLPRIHKIHIIRRRP